MRLLYYAVKFIAPNSSLSRASACSLFSILIYLIVVLRLLWPRTRKSACSCRWRGVPCQQSRRCDALDCFGSAYSWWPNLVHLKTPQSLELGLRDCHGRSLALRGMPRNDRREIHPHLTSPFEGETCDGARGKFLEELAPF